MMLRKIGFAIGLAICTAIATILFSTVGAPLKAQVATLRKAPLTAVKIANIAFNQGDYEGAKTALDQALAAYCAESGLLQPSPSSIEVLNNVSNAVQSCSQYQRAFRSETNSQLRYQVIEQLRIDSSGSYRQYQLPLEMADAFKKMGDVYIQLRNLYSTNRDVSITILDKIIESYVSAVNIFEYQNNVMQVLFENISGEQNCQKNNDFSPFLVSLIEAGEGLFEQYFNSNLSYEGKNFVLKVSAKALKIALQRMSVFSYSSAQAGLYRDGSGSTIAQSSSNGNRGWALGNSLDNRRIIGALAAQTFADPSICKTNRRPELEDRVAGTLQQVLLELDSKGDKTAFGEAYLVSDAGRTLGVDQYIAYGLEQAKREKEATLIQDLSKNLDVAKIGQIALEDNATFVSYSIVSDDQLFIWVVRPPSETQNKFFLVKLNCREKLATLAVGESLPSEQTCKSLLKQLIQPESTIDGRGQARARVEIIRDGDESQVFYSPETLKLLYQLLIQPIAYLLPEDENQHVVFIPSGPLYFAPFAALQDETGKYLIESHTIRFAPNLRTLVLNHQNQKRNFLGSRSAVVVGNPQMPFMGFPDKRKLASLPVAGLEAVTIAELLRSHHFDVTRLLEGQASKEAVVQQMERSTIVHLATHGIIEDASASIPASALEISGQIALAPSSENNGWLTALDLIKMQLDETDLVVLSACNTAQGNLIPGGVIGLPFALSLSGVQSIVASIWAVPDSPATVELMKDFYTQILSEVDVATALRRAMIKIKDTPEYADPRYWAGFTLIGAAK